MPGIYLGGRTGDPNTAQRRAQVRPQLPKPTIFTLLGLYSILMIDMLGQTCVIKRYGHRYFDHYCRVDRRVFAKFTNEPQYIVRILYRDLEECPVEDEDEPNLDKIQKDKVKYMACLNELDLQPLDEKEIKRAKLSGSRAWNLELD